jgi:hypothetical protein
VVRCLTQQMSRRRKSLLTLVAGLAVVGACLSQASVALAGEYTVYGCHTPNGAVAPWGGWSYSLQVYPAYYSDSCPNVTFMWMAASTPHGDNRYAEETFTAPPNTTIAKYTLVRAVRLVPSGGFYYQALQYTSGYWAMVEGCDTYGGCHNFGNYQDPGSSANVFTHSGQSNTTAVQLKIICGKSPQCPSESGGVSASIWLFQSVFTLQASSAPQFTEPPTGPLVGGGTLSGLVPVTISATDQGGGVYRAAIEIDGKVVQSQVLDNSTGTCQQPFTAVVPCPLSANGTVDFNTARVADGAHSLRVIVTDAAGNQAVWGPITIHTSNSPCSPVPAASGMSLRAAFATHGRRRARLVAHLTTGYSRRPMIRGRLSTSNGAPVKGAAICIATQAEYPGAPVRLAGAILTNRFGGFRYRLPRGPSRTVYVVHRVPGGAIAATISVSVRAPVKVHVNAHRLANGQVMTWKGRLPGPVPGGLLAFMQVWRGTYWQTFQQLPVARDGRWVGRYRFRFTTATQHYTFRLLVPHEAGYPYARGSSRRINIVVRG